MKKIKNLKSKKKSPIAFVPICADFIHHGHINILEKANKYGNVVAGLMTDKGIKSYKKKLPILNYNQRKRVLTHINIIKKIIPLNGLLYSKISKKYKFEYFIHGDDWKTGTQSKERKELIKTMKKWGGKVIDISYTKNISSAKIKKKINF